MDLHIRPLVISVLALTLLLAPLVSSANSRQALVFGIDHYAHLPDLGNAGRDAQALSDQLSELGFEVVLRLNADQRELYRAIDEFERRLSSSDTGVVFFAGHGIQADGRNFLIPADAQIERESDLEAEAIDAGRILESMARAGNSLNILILDACRDNPLPRRTRSAARGLAVTSIPSGAKGTAILYAAGEGQVAEDGPSGGHGVFTEALLEALETPNQKLEEVIKQVTRSVLQQTNGRQRPWSLASIQGDFVFNPKKVVVDAPASTSTQPTPISRNQIARDIWQAIKESDDLVVLKSYSDRFSDTPYAMAAEVRIAMLIKQDQSTTTSPTASEMRNWGPEQAKGIPNTPQAGDFSSAWASQTQDGQREWLLVEYSEAVQPKMIEIHETFNPGAVDKISVFDPEGNEVVVWEGSDPTASDEDRGISVIPVRTKFKVAKIKVYVDSPRVPGWNEIDAVGIRDMDGNMYWANKVEASSTYASSASYSVIEKEDKRKGSEGPCDDPDYRAMMDRSTYCGGRSDMGNYDK